MFRILDRYILREVTLSWLAVTGVLLVILVLFGGAKLPKLARSMGQAQSEFKKGSEEETPSRETDTPA